MATELTDAAREKHELLADLKRHTEAAAAEEKRIRDEIRKREAVLNMNADGIDHEKVALAKTVIYATNYEQGGDARASCVADAIKQLSTGRSIRPHYPPYGDLWHVYFGTKNYDRWRDQRSDHEYGRGPKHGSMCFEIGVTQDARKRGQANLSSAEIEAAIYYLVSLERIQKAEKKATEASAVA